MKLCGKYHKVDHISDVFLKSLWVLWVGLLWRQLFWWDISRYVSWDAHRDTYCTDRLLPIRTSRFGRLTSVFLTNGTFHFHAVSSLYDPKTTGTGRPNPMHMTESGASFSPFLVVLCFSLLPTATDLRSLLSRDKPSAWRWRAEPSAQRWPFGRVF